MLPPGAFLATAAPNRHQEPADRPPTTEEILYKSANFPARHAAIICAMRGPNFSKVTLFQYLCSLLFDNFRDIGKAADAAAEKAAAKKRELDVVLADSQKMKVDPCSHCRAPQYFEVATLQFHFITHVC